MKKGTIVLTEFPFTDLSSIKRRPAVVVSTLDPASQDVIVAFISSVLTGNTSHFDYILSDTHPDFKASGLKKSSVFKMDKLATLDKSIFSGELGDVSPEIFEELKKRLRLALDI